MARDIRTLISGEALCFSAYDAVQQSRDGAAPFLQEANFLWLTGVEEPGWKCIVSPERYYLVAPDIDDTHRTFEGGISNETALELSGADAVITVSESKNVLEGLARDFDTIFTLGEDPHAEHYNFELNPAPARLRAELAKIFKTVGDCRALLAKERAIKTRQEVETMQQAVDITLSAFESVKTMLIESTVKTEYEIEAQFSYEMRRKGAQGHAYEPIVAGGRNALTLHYVNNKDTLPENGLVLLDIGARVNGYAADITRTYAVGSPSERERAVHAAVERAHHTIINLIKPGVSLKSYQEDSDVIMKQALRGLGLLEDPNNYRKYFPHAISHGLGLDVHESLGGYETFQPGMVLTVEPGIYIPEEGIGVRIEDDILVTEEGSENLSGALATGL